jgi:hypothetical protein
MWQRGLRIPIFLFPLKPPILLTRESIRYLYVVYHVMQAFPLSPPPFFLYSKKEHRKSKSNIKEPQDQEKKINRKKNPSPTPLASAS